MEVLYIFTNITLQAKILLHATLIFLLLKNYFENKQMCNKEKCQRTSKDNQGDLIMSNLQNILLSLSAGEYFHTTVY